MRTHFIPSIDVRARRLSSSGKTRWLRVGLKLVVMIVAVVLATYGRTSVIDALSIAISVATVLALVFGWLVPKPVYDRALRSCAQTEAELARVLAHMEDRMDPTLAAGVRILEDAERR